MMHETINESIVSGLLEIFKALKTKNINMTLFCRKIPEFNENYKLSSRLFAIFKFIIEELPNDQKDIVELKEILKTCIIENELGTIAFCTPEYEPFTKVGGISVMVGDLCKEMARHNRKVVAICPYWDRILKGTKYYIDYLYDKDYNPNFYTKFKFLGNFKIHCGYLSYDFGVHYGRCDNVDVFFLHNSELYPSPYPPSDNYYCIRQICFLAKVAF